MRMLHMDITAADFDLMMVLCLRCRASCMQAPWLLSDRSYNSPSQMVSEYYWHRQAKAATQAAFTAQQWCWTLPVPIAAVTTPATPHNTNYKGPLLCAQAVCLFSWTVELPVILWRVVVVVAGMLGCAGMHSTTSTASAETCTGCTCFSCPSLPSSFPPCKPARKQASNEQPT